MVNNMKNLTPSELINKTELNDNKVKKIHLDIEGFTFLIETEGAYYFEDETSPPILFRNYGKIFVKNYSAFEARSFSPKEKLWRTLDYENIEMIVEINEKSFKDGVLSLAGGSKAGDWIEYLIYGGEFDIRIN